MKQIQKFSIVDSVVEQLRANIDSGAWPVGTRIPSEADLTGQLGVSRTPVREAIRSLVQIGLLEARQGDGTYVIANDDADVALRRRLEGSDTREVIAVRRGLDVVAAREAAIRRTSADVEILNEAFRLRDEAIEAGDTEGFVDADVYFHLSVARASHNEVLIGIYQSFEEYLRGTVHAGGCFRSGVGSHHWNLKAAVVEGDANAAVAASLALLDDQEQQLDTDDV